MSESRQRFTAKVSAPSRNIKSTARRGFSMPDHRPPSGKHSAGRERGAVWQGSSRIVDPGARRVASVRSWRVDKARARRLRSVVEAVS